MPSQLGGRPARGHCGVPLLHHVLFRRQEATTSKGLLLQPWDPGDESLSGDMEVPERQAFSRGCFVLVALSVHSEGASGEQGASCPRVRGRRCPVWESRGALLGGSVHGSWWEGRSGSTAAFPRVWDAASLCSPETQKRKANKGIADGLCVPVPLFFLAGRGADGPLNPGLEEPGLCGMKSREPG